MKTSPSTRKEIVDVLWIFGIVTVISAFILRFDFLHYDRVSLVDHLLDHILAIVAIAAGGLALRYERKLDRKFERQRENIQQIVESVTTRHIGDWPKHLKQITALVNEAQSGDELLIMVDSPGYGCLSAYDDFGPYMDSLRDATKIRSVTVKMLFHTESVAREDLRRQYKKEKWKVDDLKGLLQPHQKLYSGWGYTSLESFVQRYEDFLTAVLFTESIFCASLTHFDAPAEVRERPTELPNENCFYWLIRGKGEFKNKEDQFKKMIYAYSLFEGAGSGYAFRTSDTRLIEIFSNDFDSIWLKAKRLESDAFLYSQAFKIVKEWNQAIPKAGAATAGNPNV